MRPLILLLLALVLALPTRAQVLINEVDADQTGTDSAEFVELYDGGTGNTDLSGLVLVFFNGSDDASYEAFDLDGQMTDADGFFVLCGDAANVPNCDMEIGPGTTNLIQNGTDAVALYSGDATDFPNDTPVTTTNLLDALVYDTNDGDDAGLLVLLLPGEMQVNEDANGQKDTESIQRSPDGAGGARVTSSFIVATPTPGAPNVFLPPATGGTAVLANAGTDALQNTDIFFPGATDQAVAITITGPETGTLTDVTVTVPAAWTGLDAANVFFSGDAFTAAVASVNGQTVTITGAAITNTATGTVTLAGLTTPSPSAPDDTGRYTFEVATGDNGSVTPLDTSPEAFVIVPLAALRDVDADGVAVDLGETVAIEGTATVGSGTFDGDNLLVYVQDATGGMALFHASLNPPIVAGNVYVVKGSVTQFNGLTEIEPGTEADVIDLGPGAPVVPDTLTLAALLAAPETYEGSLLTIQNVSLVEGTWPAEGSSANLTITDDGGTTTLTLRIDSDTNLDGSPEPSFPLNLTGVLGQFDNASPLTEGYQILPRSTDDLAPLPATTVQFETATAEAGEGDGAVTVQVTITNPSPTEATTVEVTLTGGTATDGVDFEPFTTQTLTFPAGDATPQAVTITLIDDTEEESDETIVLSLQNVSGGTQATLGGVATLTLTILDDDVSLLRPIAEARALPDGERVQVRGIVTRSRGAFTYVQDTTGGLTIRQTEGPLFDAVAAGDIAPGDSLTVTGVLSTFAALKQINGDDVEAFEVISRGHPLPMPVRVTLADIAADGEQYEARLVRLESIFIEGEGTFEAATTYTIFDETLEAGIVSLRVPNADDTEVDGLPIPPQASFTGVVGQFSFGADDVGYQLMAIEATDLEPVVADAVEEADGLPETFALQGNYPNPFNPSTTLRIDLPAPARVTVEVFDLLGRRVLALPEAALPAGRGRTLPLDASALSSGVYLYRVVARTHGQTFTGTGTMTLLR
ncbi:MAG: hypothetical protein KatS3mg042_1266 [Rhodothermaceae bacterium]|nr:MAG: hypothetical protein KatS3mg042_1266 [Rhodothermaceae bacterium]